MSVDQEPTCERFWSSLTWFVDEFDTFVWEGWRHGRRDIWEERHGLGLGVGTASRELDRWFDLELTPRYKETKAFKYLSSFSMWVTG
jgi:hypothetical protein